MTLMPMTLIATAVTGLMITTLCYNTIPVGHRRAGQPEGPAGQGHHPDCRESRSRSPAQQPSWPRSSMRRTR